MCVSGASRQTTSGGLSPNRKLSSLSSLNWGGRVCPRFEEGEDSRKPGYAQIGCCCRHPGHGVAHHGGILWGVAGLGPGWCRRIGGVGCPYCRSCGPCVACLGMLSKRGRGTSTSWGQSLLRVLLDLEKSYKQRHITDALGDPAQINSPCPWRILPPCDLMEVLLRLFFVLSFSALRAVLGSGVGLPWIRFLYFLCAHDVRVFFASD